MMSSSRRSKCLAQLWNAAPLFNPRFMPSTSASTRDFGTAHFTSTSTSTSKTKAKGSTSSGPEGGTANPISWYPGHIAKAEQQLKRNGPGEPLRT